jgi:hypothetical protein
MHREGAKGMKRKDWVVHLLTFKRSSPVERSYERFFRFSLSPLHVLVRQGDFSGFAKSNLRDFRQSVPIRVLSLHSW